PDAALAHAAPATGTRPAPPRATGGTRLVAGVAAVAVTTVVAVIAMLAIALPAILDGSGAPAAGTGERTAPTRANEAGAGGDEPAETPGPETLLTPAAIGEAIAKFEAASGGTKFAQLTVYPDRASADAPTAGRRAAFDNYTYGKGADAAVRSRPSVAITTGDAVVDLKTFAWDALPALMSRAERTLKVPEPTNRYVIVRAAWAFNGDAPTMFVYLADEYGGGYLAVNTEGKVVRTAPADS
ncbi:hypothetical protein DMH08_32355, partial [Actinomadura sp. WAC 06369]